MLSGEVGLVRILLKELTGGFFSVKFINTVLRDIILRTKKPVLWH